MGNRLLAHRRYHSLRDEQLLQQGLPSASYQKQGVSRAHHRQRAQSCLLSMAGGRSKETYPCRRFYELEKGKGGDTAAAALAGFAVYVNKHHEKNSAAGIEAKLRPVVLCKQAVELNLRLPHFRRPVANLGKVSFGKFYKRPEFICFGSASRIKVFYFIGGKHQCDDMKAAPHEQPEIAPQQP